MAQNSDSRSGVQVIARAAQVLRALENEPQGLSLGEIASRVSLARSTVHRLVSALAEEQFVSSVGPQGRVRLGPGLLSLGAASRRELRDEMLPFVRMLHAELDETVDLCVLDGEHARVRVIDHLPSSQPLRTVVDTGMTMPMHTNAAGKAFLAEMSREAVEAMLPARLEALTPKTIRTRTALLSDLQNAARLGYAVADEEHSDGVSAIASLVFDQHGPVASLGVIMPSSRFQKSTAEIGHLVASISQQASAALSGLPQP
jgi:DNA-binding IclR family transcriptional regulator